MMRTDNKVNATLSCYHTFPEFLAGIERNYGPRPALSWFARNRQEHTLTYRELTGQVAALRRALLSGGLTPGAHVAIVSENSANWIIAFLAVAACGCVGVCVDTEQSDDSIRAMIERSDSKTVFLSSTFFPICAPLLDEDGLIESMILMDGSAEDKRIMPISGLYELGAALPEPDAAVSVNPTLPVELVFTSGTTSLSKMVLLSQGAVMQNLCDSNTYVQFFQRVFCSLPFYHAYGLNCAVLNSLLRGVHLYLNGNLKTAMRDLHLSRADTMLTVPLMIEALHNQLWLEAEKSGSSAQLRKLLKFSAICRRLHLKLYFKTLSRLRESVLGSLRLIISGGAHMNREICEEFDLLGVQVLQGYGITECGPLISVNCNHLNKIGSVGLVLPSWIIALDEGEILVKGPCMMCGYYRDPEQTADAFKNGWFRTGDLGYLDKEGFLYITGRKKNLIVFKSGKKVSPEKLEELVSAIPAVKEVVISGTVNGEFADDVKLTASIYPEPLWTQGLTSFEILERIQQGIDKINQTLPAYEQIQLVNIREKEFIKTGSKKIKRHTN